MVEYYSELFDGFVFTANGWVQSCGARSVRSPIIYGDASMSEPMNTSWVWYAKPFRGEQAKEMLTGSAAILPLASKAALSCLIKKEKR
jgi:5-methyltetrahydropteroyltriglutamate--homocysteine methyltransferase